MVKSSKYSLMLLVIIVPLLIIQSVEGLQVINEEFRFVGLRGYTIHAVSSSPVVHTIQINCNRTVSVYVLNRALNMSEVYTVPTDYIYSYTGSSIDESFTIASAAVSIIIYSEYSVEGRFTWDHGIGLPDEFVYLLTGIIVLVVIGVVCFIIYRIYRRRKLKE
ncbi:MAG: hypothetical protein ACTSPY_05415 [Candidatus Helarchaeota archaeon]